MSDKLELKVVFAAVDKFSKSAKIITEGAKAAAKALNENQSSIKALNRTVEQIDAFKKAGVDAAITANEFSGTRKKIDELKVAMDKVGVPTRKMSEEMNELVRKSAALKEKHEGLVRTEQQLHEKMKAAGVDTSKLAVERIRLASASADAQNASKGLQAALEIENQKMQRMRALQAEINKQKEIGAKRAALGGKLMAGGAAVNAAAAVPVMAYAKAEDAATQLRIAMMLKDGAVSNEFKAVNDMAMKLGTRLPGTAADYQDMMTMLIRQGMPAKNILGGLGEATAYLAVQLKMAPTEAAAFASKLQDATRATDKEMMGLMDTIQRTFYLGVDQNNMLAGFSKLSPALSIIKKEGAEAAKALAPLLVMADQSGMDGSAAGNAYRKIFQLALDKKKVGKGNSELAGTGVSLDFSNGKGEFGGMEKMYAQLEKLRGVNTMQRLSALKKIFGDDAETLQALTIMIEKGAAGYADVQAKMEKQADLQQRVNKQLGTLKNLWETATGTFETAMVRFGESIAPELHATAEWLGKLTERLDAWAEENPGLAGTIMTVVKWTGLLALGLGGLFLGLSAIATPIAIVKYAFGGFGIGARAVSVLTGAFGILKTAIFAVGRAMLLNPIGLIITGIAVAALLIYTYWEPIKAFFSKLWDGITTVTKLAWGELKSWFSLMVSDFTAIGANIADGIWNGISSSWAWIKEKVIGLIGELPTSVRNLLGIKSPSRVFAQIGAYTMQGLEQGISGNEDGPLSALGATAKKLAAIGAGVAIGASPMAAGAAQSGGNSYQITINAAPGTDNQGLAALVAREIERIEAGRSTRSRSRLRDQE